MGAARIDQLADSNEPANIILKLMYSVFTCTLFITINLIFFRVTNLKTDCGSWEDHRHIMKITSLCLVAALNIIIHSTESSSVHLEVDVNHTIANLSHFWESTGFW